MSTFRILSLAVIAFCAAVMNCGIAQAQWPGDFYGQEQWYMEVGGNAFDRPGDDLGIPLVTDSVTLSTLLNSGEVTDLGSGTGGEAVFGKRGGHGRVWEFKTSLANWDSNGEVISPNIASPLFPGFSPDQVSFQYDSEYYNFELNFRRAIRPGITLMAGPRVLVLHEDLEFNTATAIPVAGGAFNFTTSNGFETRNTLIGGQIGAEFNVPINRDLYVNSYIKAGGFSNPTKFRSRASTSTASETVTEQTKHTGSFVGQVGGRVYFSVCPNIIHTYVGYEATWIDGIALASAQSFGTGGTGVVTSTTPFWHSVTFGLRFDF